jgi:hypothetical protein
MGTSISDEPGSCIIRVDDDGAGSMFPLNVILCVPVYVTSHPTTLLFSVSKDVKLNVI